ncbi:MAG TPA: hypothetical protein VE545_10210 [Candidatus Dormibacteraeota bacterium]|nr:hypothetical protein [Candidatus Dormibacteraeota bacterium]
MTKQKKQLAVLAGLILVAGLVWYAESAKRVAGALSEQVVSPNYQPLPVENPALHWDSLARARKTEYKASGRNPFSMQAATPQVEAAQNAPKAFVPQGPLREPPPVPPTWPGNVSFFGYGTVPNGTARLAFLTVDGEVQVVGAGDTLLGHYRILQINNGSLEFQDINTGLHNTKALDDKGAQPSA